MPLIRVPLQANGLAFVTLQHSDASPKAPLVLMVHGFPDSADSFADYFEPLVALGLRPVALYQRGYTPTAIPADSDYRVGTLARDVIACIDHLGAKKALLVGHDWGAVACQMATSLRPDRVAGLVALSIPHLRRFLLRPTRAQLRRSAYMARFQAPWAERALLRDQQAALKALAARWSPSLDVQRLAGAFATLSDSRVLSAALGYYRAMPRALLNAETWSAALRPIEVPTVMLVGNEDGCVAAEMFSGQEHLFHRYFHCHIVPRAGHFLPLEAPQAVLSAIAEVQKHY